MGRAVEVYACITCLIIGASHVVHRRAWVEAFAGLGRLGRAGAFANGGLSLSTGAAFVAFHPAWSGPAAVLTAFGWLLVIKGAICFLAPDKALRSMAGGTERGFRDGRDGLAGHRRRRGVGAVVEVMRGRLDLRLRRPVRASLRRAQPA